MATFKDKVGAAIKAQGEEIKALLKAHSGDVIHEVTLQQAYGGMRGIKCMCWELSYLDPNEGIRFRGYTIPELREKLPKADGGEEPLPEGLFWLLMTNELPTKEQVAEVTKEWRSREALPDYTVKMLDSLPKDMHPMTQFSLGILSMQKDSIFAKKYREGMNKLEYWDPMFEDVMNLLARLPVLAAKVYNRSYKNDQKIDPDPKLDWGGNFAHMMGYTDKRFEEIMRLYLTIHADHEGGNVSAHTTHLVGTTLSDCYYSLSAGINGLAGPLHGLANQEVLRWIMEVKEKLGGGVPTKDELVKFLWDTLNSGQVIPGYGHAVLRKTDPRYTAQREFCNKWLPDDEIFKIVSMIYEVAPDILKEHGKAKNPWPNVDAHSGCTLVHFGMTEYDFYTVLFGCSRAMGVCGNLVWDRGLLMPLERPKSFTTKFAKENLVKK
jgi:citrate synthase